MLRALAIGLLASHVAWALEPGRAITQYAQQSWGDDEIPANADGGVAQTRDGYLWFGTVEGLVRFDGVRFVSFDKRNTPALHSELIYALTADADGRGLWLGTADGLVHFADGRFTRFDRADGLPNEEVRALALARDGTLWIGTRGGLARWRDGRLSTVGAALGHAVTCLASDGADAIYACAAGFGILRGRGDEWDRFAPPGLPGGAIEALYFDRAGTLWVGHGAGAGRITGGRFQALPGLGDAVYCFLEDRDGNLWIGARSLWRLTAGRLTELGRAQHADLIDVMSLLEDREGSLWVGATGGRLTQLRNGKVLQLGDNEGVSGDTAAFAFEGDALWIGSDTVSVRRMRGDVVEHVGDRAGLERSIQSLCLTRDGVLWIGAAHGLYRREGSTFRKVSLPLNEPAVAMFEDREGHLWVGGHGGAVERRADGGWTRWFTGDDVRAFAQDGTGAVWLALEAGLGRVAGGVANRVDTSRFAFRNVYALHVDRLGVLWIGTFNDGLVRYDGQRFTALNHERGLFDDVVATIGEDDDGELWLGGNRGLSRVRRRDVVDVLDGRAARVESLVLDRLDGMRGTQVNTWPPVLRPDGKLQFVGGNGILVVDPHRLTENPLPPPLTIERVLVDERPLDRARAVAPPGARKLRFEFTAPTFVTSRRVHFRWRLDGYDRDWQEGGARRAVEYTNLPPGHYQFRVTAANADGVWNAAGTQVELTLAPFFYQTRWFALAAIAAAVLGMLGLYRVRVHQLVRRGRQLGLLVDERTRELRDAQADLVRAERMASVATLVRGIAHELNNPIGFISGNIAPLKRYSDFLVALSRQLSDGSVRSQEELAALTRLSPRKDLDFVCRDLDKMMSDIAEGARRAKLIVGDLQNLTTHGRRDLVELDLHATVRRTVPLVSPRLPARARLGLELGGDPRLTAQAGQIEQLLVNLIDNAMLALSDGGRIVVRVADEGAGVLLAVRDDGAGMAEEVRRRATEPFFTTRGAGEGSGLGLAIVASIVAQHRGRLDIDSAAGSGTTVTVHLPRDASTARRE